MTDFPFMEKVTTEIDRFRRVINSGTEETLLVLLYLNILSGIDLYMPRICKDLAERCEGMLGSSNPT